MAKPKTERAPKQPKAAKPALGGLPFDAYDIVEMKRSELKGADYNPRIISDNEKKRLRAGLKKHKMVMPPTWNRRTGKLVGGHQRLSALDVLAGGAEYSLKVAVIDVSDSEEKEINILLNNPQAMGDWNLPKLEELLRDPTVDLAGTGFDMADVFRLFGDAPGATVDGLDELSKRLKAFQDSYTNVSDNTGRDDFYLVVVFRDYDARGEFLKVLGLEDNRYQDGKALQELIQEKSGASSASSSSSTAQGADSHS